MNGFQLFAVISFCICLVSCMYHFLRLIRYGKPKDFSERKGNIGSAVRYSLTTAMHPAKKESAYLHLPTYTAGLLYHLGTFLAIILFVFNLFFFTPEGWFSILIIAMLIVSITSGIGILVKRMLKKELRDLSNPDDFVSNFLVTVFQLATLLIFIDRAFIPVYFVVAGILLLYLPMGKLKHTIYFFAARYQLGYFYGWRGVWPINKREGS